VISKEIPLRFLGLGGLLLAAENILLEARQLPGYKELLKQYGLMFSILYPP
jgi:hypothetical protein